MSDNERKAHEAEAQAEELTDDDLDGVAGGSGGGCVMLPPDIRPMPLPKPPTPFPGPGIMPPDIHRPEPPSSV